MPGAEVLRAVLVAAVLQLLPQAGKVILLALALIAAAVVLAGQVLRMEALMRALVAMVVLLYPALLPGHLFIMLVAVVLAQLGITPTFHWAVILQLLLTKVERVMGVLIKAHQITAQTVELAGQTLAGELGVLDLVPGTIQMDYMGQVPVAAPALLLFGPLEQQ
jgi:hypothetical protein